MTAAEPATPDVDVPAQRSPRRLEIAAWLLGIAVFAGVAATATRRLIDTVAEVAAEIATRQTVAGLVAVALYALIATGLLIGMAFAARHVGARWTLGIGLAGTALIRLAVALGVDAPLVSDWLANHTDALRMAADGPILGDRAPGYPALLAVAYSLFGAHSWVAEGLNLVLALATGALLFDLLRRAHGPVVAGVGIGLFAVLPSLALFVAVLSWEGAAAVALLAAIWSLSVLPGNRLGLRRWRLSEGATVTMAGILAGALLGAAQYTWTWSLVLLPAFVVLAMRAAGARSPRRAAVALALAFVAVLLPAAIHNAVRHGEASLMTSSYAGWQTFVGTNAELGGRLNETDAEGLDALPGPTLRDRSNEAGRLGLQRIVEDPSGFGLLALRKQVTLWGDDQYGAFYALDWQAEPEPSSGLVTGASMASQLAWAFLALAAAWGAVQARRPLPLWLLGAVLLIASVAVLHAVIDAQPRYHAYLAPFVVGAAALGLIGGGGAPPVKEGA